MLEVGWRCLVVVTSCRGLTSYISIYFLKDFVDSHLSQALSRRRRRSKTRPTSFRSRSACSSYSERRRLVSDCSVLGPGAMGQLLQPTSVHMDMGWEAEDPPGMVTPPPPPPAVDDEVGGGGCGGGSTCPGAAKQHLSSGSMATSLLTEMPSLLLLATVRRPVWAAILGDLMITGLSLGMTEAPSPRNCCC